MASQEPPSSFHLLFRVDYSAAVLPTYTAVVRKQPNNGSKGYSMAACDRGYRLNSSSPFEVFSHACVCEARHTHRLRSGTTLKPETPS